MKHTCRKFRWHLMVVMLMVTLIVVWYYVYDETTRFRHKKQLVLDLKTDVINPHPYRFTTSHQDKCEHGGSDVFLVIVVHTAHDHVAHRQAVRATWGNQSNLPGVEIKTLFALGTTDDQKLQLAVDKEDAIYGDIIQETFKDSYKNLTLKTVMTLKWFLNYCPKAAYLMKTDDDTYVNVFNLVKTLRRFEGKSELLIGFVIKGAEPRRDVNSKWYLSVHDFSKDTLPWYTAGGTGYVISRDLVPRLYVTSHHTKPVFLEDVYIGMCVERLGITPSQNKQFHCCDKLTYDPCVYKNLITSHGIGVEEMYAIWEGDHQAFKKNCGIYHDWVVPALNYLLYT
ncbi:beta-1,3-galactosyltransferase 1-like [Branchiostoma lanceolatum]|uniref:beta-1,3-galactosyltransferase 1-like n=1 Tax=Branchiostoma lanceolatum TaxID=7740 RepID=UPI003454A34C